MLMSKIIKLKVNFVNQLGYRYMYMYSHNSSLFQNAIY